MNLKQCFLIKNDCYVYNEKMNNGVPMGILVHSTGVNQTYLKRYIQPVKENSNYAEMKRDLGTNLNSNHWNQTRIYNYTDGSKTVGTRDYSKTLKSVQYEACVHAMIGYNAKKEVETIQTLPFDICCWGCGSGSKGSYNYNPQAHIQFEILEGSETDVTYFNKVYQEAAEFCAHLCKTYGLSVDTIVSHKESHGLGYASNHSDADSYFKYFGKTMDDFRKAVDKILNPTIQNKADIQVGNLVSISSDAVYYSGKSIPDWVKNQNWYVYSISGDRVVIDENEQKTNHICSPVNEKYLTVVNPEISNTSDEIKVGDLVSIIGTKYYSGAIIPSWVLKNKWYVYSAKGDRIVINYDQSKKMQIMSAINVKDLKKV